MAFSFTSFLILLFILNATCLLPLYSESVFQNEAQFDRMQTAQVLDRYKVFLEEGTYQGQDWSKVPQIPLSRYYTYKFAFEYFIQKNGKVVVVLGLPEQQTQKMMKHRLQKDIHLLENGDWKTGNFTRILTECFSHINPTVFVVDSSSELLEHCKMITQSYRGNLEYQQLVPLDFLKQLPPESVDFLYIDTGALWPLEPSARQQLAEAKVIVENNIIGSHGMILINDVKSQIPRKYGEVTDLAKSKYSIPYFLANGFEIVANQYQVILRKKS